VAIAHGWIMSSRRQHAGPRHGCRGSVGGAQASVGGALAAASAEFTPAGWNAKSRSGNGLRAELPVFRETYTLRELRYVHGGSPCAEIARAPVGGTTPFFASFAFFMVFPNTIPGVVIPGGGNSLEAGSPESGGTADAARLAACMARPTRWAAGPPTGVGDSEKQSGGGQSGVRRNCGRFAAGGVHGTPYALRGWGPHWRGGF